jgi:hypothetical protein
MYTFQLDYPRPHIQGEVQYNPHRPRYGNRHSSDRVAAHMHHTLNSAFLEQKTLGNVNHHVPDTSMPNPSCQHPR